MNTSDRDLFRVCRYSAANIVWFFIGVFVASEILIKGAELLIFDVYGFGSPDLIMGFGLVYYASIKVAELNAYLLTCENKEKDK